MKQLCASLAFLAILIAISFAESVSGQLIISEFRLRGPNGATDEFIEIYNNSGGPHTVAGGGAGYAIVASDGVVRCIIPNGNVIPNRGHYLCVNNTGYSLVGYPAGNGSTAAGDSTFVTNIPDNAGLAIFTTSVAANFTLANRMDAVGSTSEANTLYKEGTGYPSLTAFSIDYSFSRDECGNAGSITAFTPCPISTPKDTNNNAADFIFNDTNGTSAGAGQRLGAPAPQNLHSPLTSATGMTLSPLDTCDGVSYAPNTIRDFTSDPANNSTFGTLDIRRRITNQTGGNVTRLRYRIIDLTTFPAPTNVADLRPRTSTSVVVTVDRPPCNTGTSNVTVNGTTLEQPPNQPNGGGFNSSLSSGTIALATPLANGASLDMRLLFGIQQTGTYRVGLLIEALPGGGAYFAISGHTQEAFDAPFSYDTDARTDLSIFRPSVGQWWSRRSTDLGVEVLTFGLSSDIVMAGDYTGDGRDDRAFFRPSTGQWFILRSNDFTFFSSNFGVSTDIPVPGDFDGDRTFDLAVYRPSSGTWIVRRSVDGNATFVNFGNSTDRPIPRDYDGDMKTDYAVFRPNGAGGNAEFWISYSASGSTFGTVFGLPTDKAVPGDYTGDGRADIAVWRPGNGFWLINRSEDISSFFGFPFGINPDLPTPGDYDGDGKFDAAIYRPSTGQWFISNSGGSGTSIVPFGTGTDIPLPNTWTK